MGLIIVQKWQSFLKKDKEHDKKVHIIYCNRKIIEKKMTLTIDIPKFMIFFAPLVYLFAAAFVDFFLSGNGHFFLSVF